MYSIFEITYYREYLHYQVHPLNFSPNTSFQRRATAGLNDDFFQGLLYCERGLIHFAFSLGHPFDLLVVTPWLFVVQ